MTNRDQSIDLSTTYLGLKLGSPLIIAPGPVSMELHTLRRLEEAGAAAVVVAPLFEEEIEAEEISPEPSDRGRYSSADVVCLRELYEYNSGPDAYLRHIEVIKNTLSIPVIGTLNGAEAGEWVRFARLIEGAGADALELNIYFLATDCDLSSGAVERRYVDLVAATRAEVSIPLAVKIGPFFSALPNVARSLAEAGADGLVLFNRFVQSDIDLGALELTPHLLPSSRNDLRLPLHWIAILRRQLAVSLAAAGGIHFADDLLKLLLVGADVGQVNSSVFRNGPAGLRTMLDEVKWWLYDKHFSAIDRIKGSLSHRPGANLTAFERADYLRTLVSQGAAERES